MYGSSKNLIKTHLKEMELVLKKKKWYIIMPDSTFKRYWNIVMILLLVYVGLIMPYNVCFLPSELGNLRFIDILDFVIDIFFFIDIFVNFLSAYDDPLKDVPIIEIKLISKQYIISWFLFDLVAVIPFSLFENED